MASRDKQADKKLITSDIGHDLSHETLPGQHMVLRLRRGDQSLTMLDGLFGCVHMDACMNG